MFSVTIEDDEKKVMFEKIGDRPVRSEFDKTTNAFATFRDPVETANLVWEIGNVVGDFFKKQV